MSTDSRKSSIDQSALGTEEGVAVLVCLGCEELHGNGTVESGSHNPRSWLLWRFQLPAPWNVQLAPSSFMLRNKSSLFLRCVVLDPLRASTPWHVMHGPSLHLLRPYLHKKHKKGRLKQMLCMCIRFSLHVRGKHQ